MKPQQYVIALSRPGRTGATVRTVPLAGDLPFVARTPRATLPPAHKFDCSDEELGTTLEWFLRLARARL